MLDAAPSRRAVAAGEAVGHREQRVDGGIRVGAQHVGDRLEAAVHVESVGDRQPLPQLVAPDPPVEHANIRGAEYYADSAKPAQEVG